MVANGIVGAGPGTGYVVASYNDIYNCAGGAFGGPYVTQGPGNIFSNPLFWGMPPGTPEEYDIRPFSPCVDAGDPDPLLAFRHRDHRHPGSDRTGGSPGGDGPRPRLDAMTVFPSRFPWFEMLVASHQPKGQLDPA